MKDFQPGEAINHRYRVVKRLGQGAMGTVYLTEDIVKVHRLVALKVLNSERLDDPDFWSKGEYEALTRLRHPNLARVYDFGRVQESGDYYIVSEYIRGQNLLTATRGVGSEELLDLISQVCRALEYIHTQGYVHFDVKSDNILVTRSMSIGGDEGSKVQWNPDELPASETGTGPPVVKLIDFGLAEQITGSFAFAIKGTVNYVAPEIIRGRTPDKRADLYSLGVTIYRILTERYPFTTEDGQPQGRNGNWRDEVRRAIGDHPTFLQDMVVRLIENEPDERYSSAREIIQALSAGAGRRFEVETAETQASYLYCSRLIGRQKELNRLKEEAESIFSVPLHQQKGTSAGDTTVVTRLLRDEKTRRTPLFLLSGEIGIGKSRLFEEFTHFLRMREIPVHLGNCYETSHDAYQPFREIIGEVVLSLGFESEACQKHGNVIRRLCPRLRDADDEEVEETGFRPDKERLYFIDSLAHFLLDASLAKPCVIAINNLHWADEASQELFAHLMDVLGQAEAGFPCGLPLMLVATIRSDENPLPSMRGLITELREEERIREVPLRRFSRTQIAEIIHAMLQIEEIPTPFLNRLEERTSGNPLFLVETLKGLQEEGIIARDGADWRIRGDLSRIEIPHGIEAILLRRVRMLEEHQQRILEALAVYDKPVSGKLIERFPEVSDCHVMNSLRDLQNRGMVAKQLDGGRLLFSIGQPKLREIVYQHIPSDRRKVLHGYMAQVLAEEHTGSEEEIVEDLAFHYQRSDRIGRALEFTVRAGDVMRKIFAHDRAVEHYRHVLQQTGGSPNHFDVWADTQEKIGDIGTMSGDFLLAEKSYLTLLLPEVREKLGVGTQARLLRKRGKIDEIQGEYTSALYSYKEARDLIENSTDMAQLSDERTRTYNAIGWVYVCMGKYEKAMKICVDALRLMEGVVERSEHAMLFATIGSANFYQGNLEQANEFHTRALEIRENQENIPDIIVSLNNLGSVDLASGEYNEALKHFEQALATAEDIGDAFGRAMALHHLAEAYFLLGDCDRCEISLRESLKLSRHYKMRFLNNQNYFLRGRLLARQGDLGKAEASLYRALGVYAKQGNRWGLGHCLLAVASVRLRRGNAEDALKLVEEGLECAHSLAIADLESLCRIHEVRALRSIGSTKPQELLDRLDRAAELLENSKNVELRGTVEVERGETLVATKANDRAVEAFAWAEEYFREVADRLPTESRESYLALHLVRATGEENSLEFREVPEMPGDSDESEETQEFGGGEPGSESVEISSEQQEMLTVASLLQEMGQTGISRVFLQKVLTCVCKATTTEQAFLLSCNGDDVRIAATSTPKGDAVRSAGERLCLEALEIAVDSGAPILAPRILDNPRVQEFEQFFRHNITRLAILPLKQDGATRGALYLNNPDEAHLTPPSGSTVMIAYQNLLALLLPRSVPVI